MLSEAEIISSHYRGENRGPERASVLPRVTRAAARPGQDLCRALRDCFVFLGEGNDGQEAESESAPRHRAAALEPSPLEHGPPLSEATLEKQYVGFNIPSG